MPVPASAALPGPTASPEAVRQAVEAVWRAESGQLIATLARLTGDLGAAEDLAHDALVAALETWPATGIPHAPGAWLTTTARRRALDALRRAPMLDRAHAEIARDHALPDPAAALHDALDDPVGDDLLRLVFATCHPALSTEARVALTLRLLGGLTTDEIARAFLTPVPTVAQRIVRAKKTLRDVGGAFEMPRAADLPARLADVLRVVYLVFNEGYTATSGDGWARPGLCEDALRLGRVLAGLVPDEPEVHGLAALMEVQASRLAARVGPEGEPVRLMDQDRTRWDALLVRRGLAALARGQALADGAPGPYLLQAAIAACHARARSPQDTDWPRIAALYGALHAAHPSPVVELNRAVAVSFADGPAAGLAIADALVVAGVLDGYHLLDAVRGDLLERLGRAAEARAAFEAAAAVTRNAQERAILLGRAVAV
ncbi:RNA polymerase sigma factor [Rubrivirga sp. IMCC43871]|uniref:RNA polymerase sigma factor n=1 Tax=Rubrivirga sp. IMCC43871 TaxID=3391575 RepID=UPI00399001D5